MAAVLSSESLAPPLSPPRFPEIPHIEYILRRNNAPEEIKIDYSHSSGATFVVYAILIGQRTGQPDRQPDRVDGSGIEIFYPVLSVSIRSSHICVSWRNWSKLVEIGRSGNRFFPAGIENSRLRETKNRCARRFLAPSIDGFGVGNLLAGGMIWVFSLEESHQWPDRVPPVLE